MKGMKERHGRSWSPEEEQKLKVAFLAGMPMESLANLLRRSNQAIRSRLNRLGLIESQMEPDSSIPAALPSAREESAPQAEIEAKYGSAIPPEYIDRLISALLALKEEVVRGEVSTRYVAAVTNAYAQLDGALLSTVGSLKAEDESAPEPISVRLRTALSDAVQLSVTNLKDRYVANRVLGLADDGEPITLAAIGDDLDVSRERVRQRRVRAFRCIETRLSRRFNSTARLRAIFTQISSTTAWDDPAQVAPIVVKLITDNWVAAKQFTVMCCIAAGTVRPNVHAAAERGVTRACQDPAIHGRWRFDHWREAAAKAIFGQRRHFDSVPLDLVGQKRAPGNVHESIALGLRSGKLGRTVACESGMEQRVFSWLERSPEVLWYQEQPSVVPYTLDGTARLYYPDVAVWDGEHRVVVVEVKPLFMMYRKETAAKAIAALNHFGPQGMGYLLVDASGRTLADLAYEPFDMAVAEEIESCFFHGPASFSRIKQALSRRTGRFEYAQFISMVVNRDWAVTSDRHIDVWRLPDGISFGPLLSQPAGSR
jgi:hypothetical protein